MKITGDYDFRTIRRSALALAAALVLAATAARAVNPTIEAPIKWKGGVEIVMSDNWGFGIPVYTVPAGSNFMLTDLIIANNRDTVVAQVRLFSGPGGTCDTPPTYRTAYFNVPPLETVVISLATGIGFASGKRVCLAATQPIEFTGRGFLFSAVPAS